MTAYAGPAFFALFVWWASTVAIIYLDNLPRPTFKWSMLGATAVLAGALYGLARSAQDASTTGAYVAFTCGLLVWGWQEMSFYMGFVTGPWTTPCPAGCGGFRRFVHGVETVLYHEIAIILAAAAVVWLTSSGPNQIGTWTFMVLWWMHESAKLNLFFGVPNLSAELLPEHLDYLKSFFRKRPMNLLFPVSVTASTVVTAFLAEAAMAPGAGGAERAGSTFLTALMALAIIEHWVLVLPIPTAALWSPGLKARGGREPGAPDIAAWDAVPLAREPARAGDLDVVPVPAFLAMPTTRARGRDAPERSTAGSQRSVPPGEAADQPTGARGPVPAIAAE